MLIKEKLDSKNQSANLGNDWCFAHAPLVPTAAGGEQNSKS
jgi:hypothetical protein